MNIEGVEVASLKGQVSDAEWQARVELAAMYRLVPIMGWDDCSMTHVSAKVPGEDAFLMNPNTLLFEEITPSSLIKIDRDGQPIGDHPLDVIDDGWIPMSAVHLAREDIAFCMHLHEVYGAAVSIQEQGLLPISQHACIIRSYIGYHDYDGVETFVESIPSIQKSLGDHLGLILRNHGLMVGGWDAPMCFMAMQLLQRACKIQILAQSGGGNLIHLDQAIQDQLAQEALRGQGNKVWLGLLRKLDRLDAGWRDR